MDTSKEASEPMEPEIQALQDEASGTVDVDDEDEIEELHNSLKEVVKDPSVKPKLQCLMVDQSFSIVTVQSEDSGIVWETASSRCSTPWASEGSSPSESYESSGAQGKITVIMDEDKIVRKRKKSGRSKLGERFKRPISRMAVYGSERPEMAEVSIPNVRPENEEPAELKVDKDQELFSLITEGYEILNIVVPSKLPTVDEEEASDLVDNLSFLQDTPKIKSKSKPAPAPAGEDQGIIEVQEIFNGEKEHTDQEPPLKHAKKEGPEDDYLDKFLLIDPHAASELPSSPGVPEEENINQEPEQVVPQEESKAQPTPTNIEDTFVIITDEDIASEHMDEVFYANIGSMADETHKGDGSDGEMADEPRSLKESGSALFGSQETILIPVYLPEGPPKIIDPVLLEEPRAMSFLYTDLYDEAMGCRRRDDDRSDVESTMSDKSYKKMFSDVDDDDDEGYLEKFILKDETEAIEDPPDIPDDTVEGERIIWPQSKFELTGCLKRVEKPDDSEGEKTDIAATEDMKESEKPQLVDTGKHEEVSQESVTEAGDGSKTEQEEAGDSESCVGNHCEPYDAGMIIPASSESTIQKNVSSLLLEESVGEIQKDEIEKDLKKEEAVEISGTISEKSPDLLNEVEQAVSEVMKDTIKEPETSQDSKTCSPEIVSETTDNTIVEQPSLEKVNEVTEKHSDIQISEELVNQSIETKMSDEVVTEQARTDIVGEAVEVKETIISKEESEVQSIKSDIIVTAPETTENSEVSVVSVEPMMTDSVSHVPDEVPVGVGELKTDTVPQEKEITTVPVEVIKIEEISKSLPVVETEELKRDVIEEEMITETSLDKESAAIVEAVEPPRDEVVIVEDKVIRVEEITTEAQKEEEQSAEKQEKIAVDKESVATDKTVKDDHLIVDDHQFSLEGPQSEILEQEDAIQEPAVHLVSQGEVKVSEDAVETDRTVETSEVEAELHHEKISVEVTSTSPEPEKVGESQQPTEIPLVEKTQDLTEEIIVVDKTKDTAEKSEPSAEIASLSQVNTDIISDVTSTDPESEKVGESQQPTEKPPVEKTQDLTEELIEVEKSEHSAESVLQVNTDIISDVHKTKEVEHKQPTVLEKSQAVTVALFPGKVETIEFSLGNREKLAGDTEVNKHAIEQRKKKPRKEARVPIIEVVLSKASIAPVKEIENQISTIKSEIPPIASEHKDSEETVTRTAELIPSAQKETKQDISLDSVLPRTEVESNAQTVQESVEMADGQKAAELEKVAPEVKEIQAIDKPLTEVDFVPVTVNEESKVATESGDGGQIAVSQDSTEANVAVGEPETTKLDILVSDKIVSDVVYEIPSKATQVPEAEVLTEENQGSDKPVRDVAEEIPIVETSDEVLPVENKVSEQIIVSVVAEIPSVETQAPEAVMEDKMVSDETVNNLIIESSVTEIQGPEVINVDEVPVKISEGVVTETPAVEKADEALIVESEVSNKTDVAEIPAAELQIPEVIVEEHQGSDKPVGDMATEVPTVETSDEVLPTENKVSGQIIASVVAEIPSVETQEPEAVIVEKEVLDESISLITETSVTEIQGPEISDIGLAAEIPTVETLDEILPVENVSEQIISSVVSETPAAERLIPEVIAGKHQGSDKPVADIAAEIPSLDEVLPVEKVSEQIIASVVAEIPSAETQEAEAVMVEKEVLDESISLLTETSVTEIQGPEVSDIGLAAEIPTVETLDEVSPLEKVSEQIISSVVEPLIPEVTAEKHQGSDKPVGDTAAEIPSLDNGLAVSEQEQVSEQIIASDVAEIPSKETPSPEAVSAETKVSEETLSDVAAEIPPVRTPSLDVITVENKSVIDVVSEIPSVETEVEIAENKLADKIDAVADGPSVETSSEAVIEEAKISGQVIDNITEIPSVETTDKALVVDKISDVIKTLPLVETEDLKHDATEQGAAKDTVLEKISAIIAEAEMPSVETPGVDVVSVEDTAVRTPSPPAIPAIVKAEEVTMEDLKGEEKVEEPEGLAFSPLRSFSPQEDLSVLPEPEPSKGPEYRDETADEFGYEMVTRQEVKEYIAVEAEVIPDRKAEDERFIEEEEEETGKALEEEEEPEEDVLEAEDYEFIEESESIVLSEEDQAKMEALDAFCVVCQCPVLMMEEHQNHEMCSLDKAYEVLRDRLGSLISALQERSENIEDMVTEIELAYDSVEEHCKSKEQTMDDQNEEMLKLVMEQYNEMSHTMEEEKKAKLEKLYDQIVSFQEGIDIAKETLEKYSQEEEEEDPVTFVSSSKEINQSLAKALESTTLELGPRGLSVFDDYAKGSGNGQKHRKGIPVPQKPHLQPQEANSATSTSVTVYWRVNEGDIIDCFQVYCMEDPQGAISEEYRVTVKESYCTLEELDPDKCYKVWVMAVNYTGCSLPSERLSFKTAPSVPVIHPEQCTVLWDSATLRWTSEEASSAESFTLEYCRQYALEGEGLRSVSGIRGCEQRVLLQPNENYLFYIKAVNSAGASEQSEAALISTRGTRFHMLKETAGPALRLSEDKTTVLYSQESFNEMSSINECPAILGELLPLKGYYYWETVVSGCPSYRLGITYSSTPSDSLVGENSTSWCMHCVPTSNSSRFELLHNSVETDIFVVDVPTKVGTLLDFTQGRLVFFNAQNGHLLGSTQHRFREACHPAFGLESPGCLSIHMLPEVPEFARHC